MNIKRSTLTGGAFVSGAIIGLVLDRALRARMPERGRPLAIGGVLATTGVAVSYTRSDPFGNAFALGAVAATAIALITRAAPNVSTPRATRIKDAAVQEAEFKGDEDTVSVDSANLDHIQTALDRAHAEWSRNVTEPTLGGDWRRINEYIKSDEGLGLTNVKDYTHDLDFAWCGAFVAYAWGPQVYEDVRRKMMGCTSMFNAWKDTPRFVPSRVPQPGDIVTIHPVDDRSHAPGTHILLAATSPDADGNFETYEGNTIGPGPNGDKVDGVARRVRNVSRIANIYRLQPEDFVEQPNA